MCMYDTKFKSRCFDANHSRSKVCLSPITARQLCNVLFPLAVGSPIPVDKQQAAPKLKTIQGKNHRATQIVSRTEINCNSQASTIFS
jgi:hypothetical protein